MLSIINGAIYHFTVYGINLFFGIIVAVLYNFFPSSKKWLMPRYSNIMCRILLGAAGVRLKVNGREHFDKMQKGSYLIVCNHVTTLDIPVLMLALDKYNVRYIYSARAAHNIPLIGDFVIFGFDAMGWISIKHDDSDGASLKKILTMVRRELRKGNNLQMGIFPEGIRTEDGNIQNFQDGAFYISIMLGLPIIPILTQGIYSVHEYKSFKVNQGKIGVQVLPPIYPPDYKVKDSKNKGNNSEGLRVLAADLQKKVERLYTEVPNINLDHDAYYKAQLNN